MAERNRARLAAVLAADPELELRLRTATALDSDAHQVADAVLVEHLERVVLEHARLQVVREELALGIVAGETERRLREVVRAEREEVGQLRDLVRADARARELDHRPAEILDRWLGGSHTLGQLAEPAQLLAEANERMHDLDERRLTRARLDRCSCSHDRAHLHLVDLRELESEPAAARTEHRVCLVQVENPTLHRLRRRLLR